MSKQRKHFFCKILFKCKFKFSSSTLIVIIRSPVRLPWSCSGQSPDGGKHTLILYFVQWTRLPSKRFANWSWSRWYSLHDVWSRITWNSSEHLSTLNDHTGIKGRVSYCVAGCLFKRKVLISTISFINVTIHHHLNLSKKCLSWRWSRLHQGDVRPLLISAAAALHRVILR